jgi:hypothetical protein
VASRSSSTIRPAIPSNCSSRCFLKHALAKVPDGP